jgi:hypothetical protein
VLKLLYAAVICAADRWRGLTVGEFEQRQLPAIREELDRAHAERTRPAVRHTRARPRPSYPARFGLDRISRLEGMPNPGRREVRVATRG